MLSYHCALLDTVNIYLFMSDNYTQISEQFHYLCAYSVAFHPMFCIFYNYSFKLFNWQSSPKYCSQIMDSVFVKRDVIMVTISSIRLTTFITCVCMYHFYYVYIFCFNSSATYLCALILNYRYLIYNPNVFSLKWLDLYIITNFIYARTFVIFSLLTMF